MAFAFRAAKEGRSVLVLERAPQLGGCLSSARRPDGFWFELGAHSAYNSYAGFLEIAEATGVTRQLVERGPARARFGFLRGTEYHWLTPPKVLLQLNWLEAAAHAPLALFRGTREETVGDHFTHLVGARNFREVVSPFLAAVPSQSADGFPYGGPGRRSRSAPAAGSFREATALPGACSRSATPSESSRTSRCRRG